MFSLSRLIHLRIGSSVTVLGCASESGSPSSSCNSQLANSSRGNRLFMHKCTQVKTLGVWGQLVVAFWTKLQGGCTTLCFIAFLFINFLKIRLGPREAARIFKFKQILEAFNGADFKNLLLFRMQIF